MDSVAAGQVQLVIGAAFSLTEIVAAHQLMESNQAGGKIAVVT
ncbi:zinc-binding dehydrogenase [Hymenobacter sp. RP-2-7]|uniref:Zinc-binding dehydrogenase n=1 Tax=Hymenobacter polaris TaxID=2682546 RepID=A0A7Y0FNX5_9BACT|nr:zinc-binding dehydrogenase [Hymenobacter polaris]